MTDQQRMRFWLIAIAVFLGLLYLLRDILLPFVAGMAIAYFLDPVADRLERARVPRTLATLSLIAAFFLVIVFVFLLLVPLLVQQLESLAASLPGYIETAREGLTRLSASVQALLSPEDIARARDALGSVSGRIVTWLIGAVGGVLQSGKAVIDLVSLVVITPVVAFYLLRDWDRMVERIDGLLPREHAPVIRQQLIQIDRTLAGFARGQATVCLVLATFYSVALTVAGLQFGVVIGLLAGAASFIPFVGSIGGLVLSVGLALLQFDELWRVGVVAAIFIAGQAVEGNYLTPKLVGDRVGLHAVWVMFALLAGGSLFGFVGVLLAVPIAAVIGVLVRFATERYRASALFGAPPPPAPPP